MRNSLHEHAASAPGITSARLALFAALIGLTLTTRAQFPTDTIPHVYLLRPDAVFDGEQMHEGWQVLVQRRTIVAVGPASAVNVPAGAITLDLKGMTLLPGLIEGHSHLFLHPYNEVPWDDQVLKESRAERTARAVVHARQTLLAGFTSTRDLGTEGEM
jgi:imidazolonepropionase-like amidohydrolase